MEDPIVKATKELPELDLLADVTFKSPEERKACEDVLTIPPELKKFLVDTDNVRGTLPTEFDTSDKMLEALWKKQEELTKMSKRQRVGWDKFIEAFAKDFCVRDQGTDTNYKSFETAAIEARRANQGRGFTDYQDVVWMLEGPIADKFLHENERDNGLTDAVVNDSDEVHEFVHVTSGPGGKTKIMALNNDLNEGFTQFFTEEMCKKQSIPIAKAYESFVAFVEKLQATHGYQTLFNAYFKGNLDGLLKAMTAKYFGYIQAGKLKDGKSTPGRTEKLEEANTVPKARANLIAKLRDFQAQLKWLELRTT